MALDAKRIAELKLRAEQRLANVPADKFDHALINVLPRDVLALCDAAVPTTDDEVQKVADLRLGSQRATRNAQLDGVYVTAADLLVLAVLASPPAASPAVASVPADAAPADAAPTDKKAKK